jgi:hypothetical protein
MPITAMSDEIRQEVRAKVLQYLAFEKLETNKFDVKKEWYKLRESKGKNEFLRDATAMINSYGGENSFIVFGIEEKTKELFDTKIEESGHKDSASIKNIVDSSIDKPFRFDVDHVEVDGKNLSFIYLHPSPDKPHIIVKFVDDKGRIFENAIFIRSGSAKVAPTKGDLDRMYIERNTILVERKADVAINFHGFQFSEQEVDNGASRHVIDRPFLIENRGTRVLPIYKIYLQFDVDNDKLLFVHETKSDKPIVIEPNAIYRDTLTFVCNVKSSVGISHKLTAVVNKVLENPRHGDVVCRLILATGEYLPANLYMPNINHLKEPPPNLADMILYRTSLD